MALGALTPEARSYSAIAPPLAEEDFPALPTLSLPVCLITAAQETLLAAPEPFSAQPRITSIRIEGADHFFRNREEVVAGRILQFLTEVPPTCLDSNS